MCWECYTNIPGARQIPVYQIRNFAKETIPMRCLVFLSDILKSTISTVIRPHHTYCAFHVLVQTNFQRYYFLPLAQSSSNSPRSFEGFRRTLVQSFIQIQQRAFFIMWVYVEILHLLSNPFEISHQSSSNTFQ